jgi:hypothetical protein
MEETGGNGVGKVVFKVFFCGFSIPVYYAPP